jgi:hypothetical protein
MRINIYIKLFLFGVAISSHSYAFELILGETSPSDFSKLSDVQEKTWGVIADADIYPDSIVPSSENNIYIILNGLSLGRFNIVEKSYLGSWYLRSKNPCNEDDRDCVTPWWIGRWNADEPLGDEAIVLFNQYRPQKITYRASFQGVGCLSQTPLRYGDIGGSGNASLVLFLNNDFLIFNPTLGKVEFLAALKIDDWLTLAETAYFMSDTAVTDKPQYLSEFAATSAFESKMDTTIGEPANRGYAKLYFGDLDGNTSPDIIVWRKYYKSLMVSDSQKGFTKLSDHYFHYSLTNGVYKKIDTSTEDIRKLLDTKKLTWQKGYPSKSECAGQEGKLIPEMHDVLLNDPDVLK